MYKYLAVVTVTPEVVYHDKDEPLTSGADYQSRAAQFRPSTGIHMARSVRIVVQDVDSPLEFCQHLSMRTNRYAYKSRLIADAKSSCE